MGKFRTSCHDFLERSLIKEEAKKKAHWMINPDTGEAYVTTQAVAVTFDLDKRKAIPAPPEQIKELEQLAPRGLVL